MEKSRKMDVDSKNEHTSYAFAEFEMSLSRHIFLPYRPISGHGSSGYRKSHG